MNSMLTVPWSADFLFFKNSCLFCEGEEGLHANGALVSHAISLLREDTLQEVAHRASIALSSLPRKEKKSILEPERPWTCCSLSLSLSLSPLSLPLPLP